MTGRLRVLHVLGPGEFGGIQRHVQTLLHHLGDRIDTQTCFVYQAGQVSTDLANDGFAVHVLNKRHGWDLTILPALSRILLGFKPHIVHFHELHLTPLLTLFCFPAIPTIYTEHCSVLWYTAKQRARILWRLGRWRLNLVIGVSSNSVAEIHQVMGFPAQRMRVLPNALDLDRIPPRRYGTIHRELGLPEGCLLVGAAGRLVQWKGWDAFLQVAAIVVRRREDVRFVVIGDGPHRPMLTQMAVELGIADRVHWLGWRSDALELVGSLDMYLMTSEREQFPFVVLEAFAMGTPVVGFLPEGGVRDILEADPARTPALLIEERSVSGLSDLVLAVLGDARRREALVRDSQAVLREHLDLSKVAERLVGIYEELARVPRR